MLLHAEPVIGRYGVTRSPAGYGGQKPRPTMFICNICNLFLPHNMVTWKKKTLRAHTASDFLKNNSGKKGKNATKAEEQKSPLLFHPLTN